jgi:indole-3-glycerol phosphate synthase
MNILDRIIAHKRTEVEQSKKNVPVAELEHKVHFERKTLSLKQSLPDESKTGIIAEYKRRSPSKGVINDRNAVEAVTADYTAFGASGLSVLTDQEFFGGSLNDLLLARRNQVPILRKDFMIDEYQLIEAKAYGADVILLIAACLSPNEVRQLASTAKSLGLQVLLELHDESELGHIVPNVDLVGVNNRNLKTFEVDLQRSASLSEKIGDEFIKVAESGITTAKEIHYLKQVGFKGFLMGEFFMKHHDPGKAFQDFVKTL